MFERIHQKLGTAGFIISIVALVAALAGGALAATGGSGDSKATASAKGKPGPRGKTGKTGPAGAVGPAGPVGPQGAAGANGKDGSSGTNGTNGATGATGKNGNTGAVGAVGETGPTGPPGAAGSFGGGFLGSGITETGSWAATGSVQTVKDGDGNMVAIGNPIAYAPISFPQPVDFETLGFGAAGGWTVHFRTEPNFTDFDEGGPEEVGCKGSPSSPTAPPRALCVYVGGGTGGVHEMAFSQIGVPPGGIPAVESGTQIWFAVSGPGANATGTWAVTAP
jgi:hypothetical protein